MSIFRRESDTSEPQMPAVTPRPSTSSRPKPAAQGKPKQATHIAAGSKVVGQISGQTELVVDGEIDGEINLESQVTIGASGRMKGEIQAQAVQVGGKVRGNVHGYERVEVLASGSLEGDVVAPRVVIAEGAFFKGKVEMTDKVKSKNEAAQGGDKRAAGGSGGMKATT